jgi:two-component system sensor histidine kinase YesM
MTEETLKELIHDINHGTGEKGYGLYNVNRRLKLFYDVSDGIEIKSEYKKGTTVSFVLEIEENGDRGE